MSDQEFLAAFEQCRIPKGQWTHESHVRMAWLYLGLRPLAEVVPIVREGIRRYNGAVGGKPEAYHETITVGMLTLIDRERQAVGPGETFEEFRDRTPGLFDRTLSSLLRHYRRETLFSDRARSTFVEPDRLPLAGRDG